MFNNLKRCWMPLLAALGIFPLVALLAWGVGLPWLSCSQSCFYVLNHKVRFR